MRIADAIKGFLLDLKHEYESVVDRRKKKNKKEELDANFETNRHEKIWREAVVDLLTGLIALIASVVGLVVITAVLLVIIAVLKWAYIEMMNR